ncbi:hypothetical protein L5F43_12525 [Aliarcobacter butzleri]|uniref:hypothetical protein n=1 Tax=Aliarcobacter butzleri TaxID=28197 RepID=UPI001EDC7B74|nr:hypothetical protein [Aliarcobacter butzleri]MCG3707298.1 hypothetical protein [Aliarcobacter butzleri]
MKKILIISFFSFFTLLNAENLLIKRDFGIACSLLKNYDLKNVVWIDSSTNSSFSSKEIGIRTFEEEIIPLRFGESNLSLKQGGVLYAQQQTSLFLVSLKSLYFWENLLITKSFSDEEKKLLVDLYVAGFLFDENPKIFFQNVRESLKATKTQSNYTNFRTIVSGIYFLERILTNKTNTNIKSNDFKTFIENIILGNHNEAIKLLLDKDGIFVKSYNELNLKCEEVNY